MKCPKCDYLSFETGDRCRNCGYDFSLLTAAVPPAAPDLILNVPPDPRSDVPPRVARGRAAALPLFTLPGDHDDEPLVRLPVAPRPPLSVRKTPETPRLRSITRPARRIETEPVLQFVEETAPMSERRMREEPRGAAARGNTSTSGSRLGAALIDHLILFGIDAAVVYFTLRMAALPLDDWRLLPAAPLVAFLGLVKFAYFCAFTAVGGQTIGKMATGIRVVTDDEGAVDGARAIRRTLAGITAVALGLGFLPALVGADRRALHDRVAHTRVVALRPV